VWDTRIAKAYRMDELRDAAVGISSQRRRTMAAQISPQGAFGSVRKGLGKLVRVALYNLRRVKPVPADP